MQSLEDDVADLKPNSRDEPQEYMAEIDYKIANGLFKAEAKLKAPKNTKRKYLSDGSHPSFFTIDKLIRSRVNEALISTWPYLRKYAELILSESK